MRAAVDRIQFLFALLALFAAAGCSNVCDQMCDAEADMIERCLPTWDTTWTELSYSDRADFEARCYGVWGGAIEELDKDDPDRVDTERRCERDLEIALSDTDCESLLSIDP